MKSHEHFVARAAGGRTRARSPVRDRGTERGSGTAHAHRHLRPLLVLARRPPPVAVVGRVPLLPPSQPRPLARPAREVQGGRVQHRVAVLQLGLPLARAGHVRLQRRQGPRPAAGDRGRRRAVRARPARSLHQRRARLRRLPGVADDAAGQGAHQRRRLPGRLGAVVRGGQPHHRPPPVHRRPRAGDPFPDRERVRRRRRDVHGGAQGGRPPGRHHRADIPQRQGPQPALVGGPGSARDLRHRHVSGGLRLQPHLVPRPDGLPLPARRHVVRPAAARRREPAVLLGRVPGRRVRPLGRARLRPLPRHDRPDVRAHVLREQHREPVHRAEPLHDVRRHQLGLAGRPQRRLHLVRLRGGVQRDAEADGEGPGAQAARLPGADGDRPAQGRRPR